MKRQIKKKLAFLLSLILVLGMAYVAPSAAEAVTITPHLTKSKITIVKGSSKKFSVTAKYFVKVRYSSSNKSVATVSRKGKTATVKAKRKGSCKIKAVITYKKRKSSKKTYKKTLYCKITVKNKTTTSGSAGKTEPSTQPESSGQKETTAQPESSGQEETGSGTGIGGIGFIGGGTGSIEKEPETKVPEADFVSQTADFSVNIFKQISSSKIAKGQNVLVSAESILSALLMTCNGADGQTFDEMKRVLTGDMDYDSYVNQFAEYADALAASKNVKFHQANSIWVKDDPSTILIKEDFVQKNQSLFKAECYSEPFNNDTLKKINSWVKTATDGMIPSILDEMDPEMVMCIMNALVFDGQWATQYEEYQIKKDQTFTNSKGKSEKATMLTEQISSYLKDDKALGFTKSYAGGKFALVTILPNEGTSVEEYLSEMTGESFLKFYKNRVYGKAVTRLPKFSYDDGGSIADTLKEMGIQQAFSDTEADFSKMATSKYPVYIGDVIHKTHIELDENGTKAAAVTAVICKATSCAPDMEEPIEIFLDRPFIYAIVSTDTGLPVFMGAVNSVAK